MTNGEELKIIPTAFLKEIRAGWMIRVELCQNKTGVSVIRPSGKEHRFSGKPISELLTQAKEHVEAEAKRLEFKEHLVPSARYWHDRALENSSLQDMTHAYEHIESALWWVLENAPQELRQQFLDLHAQDPAPIKDIGKWKPL